MSGNNVSHAHNKTRRRYLPNIQRVSIFSEVLNRPIRLKVSASAIRTVEHAGGLDKFLADAKEASLFRQCPPRAARDSEGSSRFLVADTVVAGARTVPPARTRTLSSRIGGGNE